MCKVCMVEEHQKTRSRDRELHAVLFFMIENNKKTPSTSCALISGLIATLGCVRTAFGCFLKTLLVWKCALRPSESTQSRDSGNYDVLVFAPKTNHDAFKTPPS